MESQIFKRDIMMQKFLLQKYKIGEVVFISSRKVRMEDDVFWIRYRHDSECLLEDTLDYGPGFGSSNLALERTLSLRQMYEQDLDTDYYALIEKLSDDVMLSHYVVRPYLIGTSDVGAFAFETIGDLSLYCNPRKTPVLTIEEAYDAYMDNIDSVKELTLEKRQPRRIWTNGVGRLK